MFDGLVHHYQLHRLRRKRRATNRWYKRKYNKAKKANASADEQNRIVADWQMDTELFGDDISEIVTQRLTELAAYYLVPVPERSSQAKDDFPEEGAAWVRSDISRRFHLSNAAASDLRSAIRKEQRERSELVFRWLPILFGVIGAIAGAIGATVGLLAFIAKSHGG